MLLCVLWGLWFWVRQPWKNLLPASLLVSLPPASRPPSHAHVNYAHTHMLTQTGKRHTLPVNLA